MPDGPGRAGLGLATGVSSGPLALGQHGAGLFVGGAVDVVVAEEDLRGGALGHSCRRGPGLVGGGEVSLWQTLSGRTLPGVPVQPPDCSRHRRASPAPGLRCLPRRTHHRAE